MDYIISAKKYADENFTKVVVLSHLYLAAFFFSKVKSFYQASLSGLLGLVLERILPKALERLVGLIRVIFIY